MMSVTVWGPLTVDVFFKDYNWSGQPRVLASTETSSLSTTQTSWLSLKVQEFFNQNNWRGQAIASTSVDKQVTPVPTSLIMPVGEFFQLGVWKGLSKPAAVSKSPTIPNANGSGLNPDSDYNLSDLSDLF